MAERPGRLPWLSCVGLAAALAVVFYGSSPRLSASDAGSAISRVQSPPPDPTSLLTDSEIERFLLNADVVKTKTTSKGITGSLQATLSDGKTTHYAHIQSIDESKREFQSMRGTEFNFRDSWTFNVVGYKLDRLLGLNLVPVSVSRRYQSKASAFTWWVDDVMMDEGDRLKKKIQPPSSKDWNEQMQLVRLFDQLIANVDRNMGNLLISKEWRVWAIDHTRAFRTYDTLKSPQNVTRCERQVFARLQQLDKATLKREVGSFLDDWQIRSLLARRDAIVAKLEQIGPVALFDR